MAVKGISLEDYVFTSANDTDPKTEFTMEPMKRFDTLKVGALFADLVPDGEATDSDADKHALAVLGGEDGDRYESMLYGFMLRRCKEVKNFDVGGEMYSGKIDGCIDSIPPMIIIECIGDAINRTSMDEDEEKN